MLKYFIRYLYKQKITHQYFEPTLSPTFLLTHFQTKELAIDRKIVEQSSDFELSMFIDATYMGELLTLYEVPFEC